MRGSNSDARFSDLAVGGGSVVVTQVIVALWTDSVDRQL